MHRRRQQKNSHINNARTLEMPTSRGAASMSISMPFAACSDDAYPNTTALELCSGTACFERNTSPAGMNIAVYQVCAHIVCTQGRISSLFAARLGRRQACMLPLLQRAAVTCSGEPRAGETVLFPTIPFHARTRQVLNGYIMPRKLRC